MRLLYSESGRVSSTRNRDFGDILQETSRAGWGWCRTLDPPRVRSNSRHPPRFGKASFRWCSGYRSRRRGTGDRPLSSRWRIERPGSVHRAPSHPLQRRCTCMSCWCRTLVVLLRRGYRIRQSHRERMHPSIGIRSADPRTLRSIHRSTVRCHPRSRSTRGRSQGQRQSDADRIRS